MANDGGHGRRQKAEDGGRKTEDGGRTTTNLTTETRRGVAATKVKNRIQEPESRIQNDYREGHELREGLASPVGEQQNFTTPIPLLRTLLREGHGAVGAAPFDRLRINSSLIPPELPLGEN